MLGGFTTDKGLAWLRFEYVLSSFKNLFCEPFFVLSLSPENPLIFQEVQKYKGEIRAPEQPAGGILPRPCHRACSQGPALGLDSPAGFPRLRLPAFPSPKLKGFSFLLQAAWHPRGLSY